MTKKVIITQMNLDPGSSRDAVTAKARNYENNGADGLLIWDLSTIDEEHDKSISLLKELCDSTDFPLYCGGNIKRVEDVKKILYAGCEQAVLDWGVPAQRELLKKVSLRFGKEKIAVFLGDQKVEAAEQEQLQEYAAVVFTAAADVLFMDSILLCAKTDGLQRTAEVLKLEKVSGAALEQAVFEPDFDFMERKHALKEAGIAVFVFETTMEWSEFKLNSDGMLPVIVQDVQTDEVLMMAYMNEEAYLTTLKTGRMTYYSRSRQELWIKGLTSGHFQYVKSLAIDCDKDTMLAKVVQIGAACHTGNRNCFYQELVKKEFTKENPYKVFESVFSVIQDRKENPKEGSYTNYLFDKGVDKILKKVGEEATEIVIAAKNPDSDELKYEISDFLYHIMVLMAEQGVSWEDITKELARR